MTIVIEFKSEMMSLKTAKIIEKYMQMSTSLKKFTCWRHVTLLEINSIQIFFKDSAHIFIYLLWLLRTDRRLHF